VITSKLAFLDLKDLFVCSVLIYYFRMFEKRFGSRKFCVSINSLKVKYDVARLVKLSTVKLYMCI